MVLYYNNYIKKILFGLYLIFSVIGALSQSITGGEYFFDTEPAIGGGTNFSLTSGDTINQNLSIPLTSLIPGFHKLFIRVKNTSGIWSHYEGRVFYIMQPVNPTTEYQLVSGEWFVDSDPGPGKGTAFDFAESDSVNTVLNIPSTSLPPGFHKLFIRVKNASGIWSHYEGRLFYILPPDIVPTNQQLISGEWFVDSEPGVGKGASFSFAQTDSVSMFLNINTSVLGPGTHYLFIRVKDINNKWSHFEGRLFTICNELPAAPDITGDNRLCTGENLSLDASSIPGALSYLWKGPNGFSSLTQNLTINDITESMSGLYTVVAIKGTTACDTSYADSVLVSVNPLPTSTISGTATICNGQDATLNMDLTGVQPWSITYTDGTIQETIINISDSPQVISVSPDTTTTYTITSISDANMCSNIGGGSAVVTVNPLPTATISGTAGICEGQSRELGISLTGTQPWTITYTDGTNPVTIDNITSSLKTILVTPSLTTTYNFIDVFDANCSNLINDSAVITLNPVPLPTGVINGTSSVCQGQSEVSYYVPAISNTKTYTWEYSGTGAIISSTNNSVKITFSNTATSGNLTVKGTNDLCFGAVSENFAITVNPLPDAAGIISGPAEICIGTSDVNYAIPAITNADSYIWTLPDGSTGSSITKDISVNYGEGSVSGPVTVKGRNICGDGNISNYDVIVNAFVEPAGTISGSGTVCQGQDLISYIVPVIDNAISYIWNFTGTGATVFNIGSSATINFSNDATSGDLNVKGINSCGAGTISANYAIIVNPLPAAAGSINGSATVCYGENSVYYSVPIINNATSYFWNYSGNGATLSSESNNASINFSNNSTPGILSITGSNNCGYGKESNLALTIKAAAYPKIKIKWDDVIICYNLNDSLKQFQWHKNSEIMHGETKQFLVTNKQAGSYFVETLDINGCKCTSDSITISDKKSFSVYPNPAYNSFAISLKTKNIGRAVIHITNSTGIKVMELQVEKTDFELLKEIPTANLIPGIYMVRLMLNNEELYDTGIVVMKKDF